MIIPVADLGSVGIITDAPPQSLPPNAWSAGSNIRFRENAVHKAKGWSQPIGTPTVAPYWLLPYRTATDSYWIYAGLSKVYVTDGTTHTNITRQTTGVDVDYNATADLNWTGLVFNGVPILNNGVDAPQMWSPPQVSTKLVELSNWPASTAKCSALRGFKNYLIALNYTDGGGTVFPRLVKWSHGAGLNSVPSSWDDTDDTKDAGAKELADTRGEVVDGLAFRDSFLIYKDDSIWGMSFIGGSLVFRFYQLSLQLGVLSRRCIAEWELGHFVFGKNDIVITDGQTVRSIIDQKARKRVFNTIDADNFERCFVVPDLINKEMWACYPTSDQPYATEAMVWNWADNTISFRELPGIADASYGVVSPGGGNTWNADSQEWDADSSVWDEQTFNPSQTRIMMAGPVGVKLFLADDPASNTKNGSNMTSYVERTGLFNETSGEVKYCRAVYPRMTSTGPVLILIGSQMSLDGPVTWHGPYTFDPQTDYKIDCQVSFRWMGIRIGSNSDIHWTLTGYDLDMETIGRN